VDVGDAAALVGVEAAQVLDRGLALGFEEFLAALRLHQLAERLLHRVEPHAVEVVELAELLPPLPVRDGELRVLPEDLLRARVEAQVDDAPVEVRAQFVDLVLAFLPARGDGGEVALDPDLLDDGAECALKALRS
jgi:hypothetical protein